MRGSAPPNLHTGTNLTLSKSQATKQASIPAPREAVFLVSLGDLIEPKGFESPAGGATSLTLEKASDQYRKTETHRKAYRDTQRERDTVKTTSGGNHTFIHLNRQRESRDISHGSRTLDQ